MPDDERKARRLGDETKGRIADLASGWTMDGNAAVVPEPPIRRDAPGPTRDAPRRKTKTLPPPPPSSAARWALEDESAPLSAPHGDPDQASGRPSPPQAGRPPPTPRSRTGPAPLPGKRLARDPLDLSSLPEADKTKENRGAVGIKHDRDASLTANAASGTIGGDTPPPIFDRAAIASGQRGALASDRIGARPGGPTGDPSAGVASSALIGSPSPGATGSPRTPARGVAARASQEEAREHVSARGTPDLGAMVDRLPLSPPPPAVADLRLGPPLDPDSGDDSIQETRSRSIDSGLQRSKDENRVAARVAPVGALPEAGLRRAVPAGESRGAESWEDPRAASPEGGLKQGSERGDPTVAERPDATAISPPASGHAPTGMLRSSAALPRRPGVAGDLRYVATVVFGLREARRELAAITARQAIRQQSRRHHLVTLGRAAVTADGFDHPTLAASRETLSRVEDERSQHAGHVIAADTELARVRRDREARATQYATDLAALDAELATLAKKLEPLSKEAAATRKRGTDLHEALRRIDAKIIATEASLDSGKGGKLDRAQIQAEIATLRADRKAIQTDEPAIAGQLDALNPRIAALEAAQAEARRKRTELDAAVHDDLRRVEELLAAIGAKRKVVDRAVADAEALRDKILFQLGERLYVDRPDDLTAELAPIDEIDLELGEADRRTMELREILGSVDRWKLARGIALLVATAAVIGALAGWLIFYPP